MLDIQKLHKHGIKLLKPIYKEGYIAKLTVRDEHNSISVDGWYHPKLKSHLYATLSSLLIDINGFNKEQINRAGKY